MKHKLLDYLRCPLCGGALSLAAVTRSEAAEIMEGELACNSCARRFSIVRGVPRFAPPEKVEADKAATAENFGWQWQHFVQTDELYADQFLGWIAPVRPEFFQNKIVLEGGCGKGRHTQLAANWGAREVIGVDLSDAVETAFAATRQLPNAHIVQADIYHLPFARSFDYAFSIGVLHHLPDPQGGFRSLASKVKSGGQISAWVYGAENNEWITRFIDPLREKLSSRIKRRRETGASSFLQRLPQRDFAFWLAGTTHDRVRSFGGANFTLHTARRFRKLVARHCGRGRRYRRGGKENMA